MLKKSFFCLFTLLFALAILPTSVFAQRATNTKPKTTEKKVNNFVDGLTVGSYVGLGFGGNSWQIEFSPSVGHTFLNDRFIGGLGVKYQHAAFFQNSTTNDRETYTTIGPRAYLQGHIARGYYGIFEYQYLFEKAKLKDNNGNVLARASAEYDKFYLGAGFNPRFGQGGGMTVELLFDLNYDGPQDANIFNRLVYRLGYFYTF